MPHHKVYEELFGRSPVAILVHVDEEVQYANDSAVKLLGSIDNGRPVAETVVTDRFDTTEWPVPGGVAMLIRERAGDADQRFRSLFEDAPVAYHEIDSQGIVIRVNRAESELLGFRPEEMLGRPVWELVASEQRSLSEQRVKAKLTGLEKLVPFERPYTRRDGKTILLEVHERLILDESGTTVGIRTSLFDITDKKTFSEELQRKNEALDQALKVAKEAAQLKSQFLANMSHEIRTPMNGVIGMTGLLLDTELTPEQRDYVETVRRSAESLLSVINDILDFSRIEAGKLHIETAPFELHLVIEEVNEMLAHRAEDHDVDLIVEYPRAVPRGFVGDAGRIRQVLTNLVGNALKFTRQGNVVVAVECESSTDTHATVKMSVRDTGIGIPADKIGFLFEKFSQVDGSSTRRYGGAGLGLAISKQLVELMGGTIGVASAAGKGSTFWFSIPLRLGPELEPAPVAELNGLRALVVDDNTLNRRMLHEQVAQWGLRDDSFASALEVIPAMRQAVADDDPYRFVLLDFQMPDMDGAALAEAIKSDPQIAGASLIMLTSVGHLTEVRAIECIDASLVKPVRRWQLLNALSTSWAKQSGRPQTTVAGPRTSKVENYGASGARVLLVEDNIVNQKVAARMLERMGLRPDVAADGREAVTMFRNAWYDLIFMDCQMPEMDGYAATQEIRRLDGSERRVVIVAMTAEAMDGARERCLAAGMDDYIAKPVKLESLGEALKRWAPKLLSPEAAEDGAPGGEHSPPSPAQAEPDHPA